MFGQTFGHDLIKKYVIFFGTMFNNIHLNRYDNSGNLVQTQKVPLNYGPREKFLGRADGNPDGGRAIAMQLPRISFMITNMYYDPLRARPRTQRIAVPIAGDPNNKQYQYSPVPYNIDFQLSIMVKNAQDGTYIVEQILPFFQPDFTATLLLNPDLNLKYDVPLSLNNISQTDTYEGDFVARRAIIWELNFTLKGWIMGPTKDTDGKIIKEIDLGFGIPPSKIDVLSATAENTTPAVSVKITPGQDANGHAVAWTGDANAAARPDVVDPMTVSPDDEWAFITDFTENL